MKSFMMKLFSGLTLVLLLTTTASATTYQYLQNPLLTGNMAGPDLLWGTGDDFSTFGGFGPFNTIGAASGFLDSAGTFGSFAGTFEVSGSSIINGNFFGEFSNLGSVPPDVNVPLSYTGASGNLNVNLLGNTATSSYSATIDSPSFVAPITYNAVGDYAFINKGDDYHTIFAGDPVVISQFDFLVPLLPADWQTIFIGMESYSFAGIPVSGNQGVVFYSTVPVPAAWVLFASGTFLLGFYRKKHV